MVFPKIDTIYVYNGVKYIVLTSSIFKNVMVQNIIKSNDVHENSHFKLINWWKFMFKAKFIEKKKISKAY